MGSRLFIGFYPTGIVYADKTVEEAGDYKRLAYLNYRSLELEFSRGCPPDLQREIKSHVKGIQKKRGERLRVSTAGQTVVLGA